MLRPFAKCSGIASYPSGNKTSAPANFLSASQFQADSACLRKRRRVGEAVWRFVRTLGTARALLIWMEGDSVEVASQA
jgi:hypothetical protein